MEGTNLSRAGGLHVVVHEELDLDARESWRGTLATSAILQFEAWAVMVWSNSAPPPWSVQLIVTPGLASSD